MSTITSTTTNAARDEALRAIVSGTAAAVAGDATRASVVFTTSGRSTGAVATDVAARQHTFVVDEPASLGGDDSATNPVEYALGAFIGCQVVTYRFWAAHLGIQLDDVEITAAGDLDVRGFFGLDEAVRPGFTEVRVDVRLTGPESDERYAELQAAVDAHCPVLDLFANATPVRTSLITG
ncbi:MAG TPA: OsmC family protein [Actinotalea sp.]